MNKIIEKIVEPNKIEVGSTIFSTILFIYNSFQSIINVALRIKVIPLGNFCGL